MQQNLKLQYLISSFYLFHSVKESGVSGIYLLVQKDEYKIALQKNIGKFHQVIVLFVWFIKCLFKSAMSDPVKMKLAQGQIPPMSFQLCFAIACHSASRDCQNNNPFMKKMKTMHIEIRQSLAVQDLLNVQSRDKALLFCHVKVLEYSTIKDLFKTNGHVLVVFNCHAFST